MPERCIRIVCATLQGQLRPLTWPRLGHAGILAEKIKLRHLTASKNFHPLFEGAPSEHWLRRKASVFGLPDRAS